MYPHERSLVQRLADKPFVIFGINSDRDRAKLKKRMAEERITWPVLFDGSTGGPVSRAWGVHAWPTVFLIDANGVIRYKTEGVDEKVLDKQIDKLLKEMPNAPTSQPSND